MQMQMQQGTKLLKVSKLLTRFSANQKTGTYLLHARNPSFVYLWSKIHTIVMRSLQWTSHSTKRCICGQGLACFPVDS